MQELLFKNIVPFIRYYHQFKAEKERMIMSGEVYMSYDNKLLYCLDGSVTVVVENENFSLKKGSAIYLKLGIKYSYKNCQEAELVGINFDFTQQSLNRNDIIIPSDYQKFDAEKITEMVIFKDALPLNKVVFIEKFSDNLPDILRLGKIYNSKIKYYNEKCSSLLKILLSELLTSFEIGEKYSTVKNKATDIINYIENNYNNKINNILIGKALNYHPYYLNKIMLEYTGITLHKYLVQFRIKKSIEFLNSGEFTVGQVSEAVGFDSVQHFTNAFRKNVGASPSSYIPRSLKSYKQID